MSVSDIKMNLSKMKMHTFEMKPNKSIKEMNTFV